MGSRAHFSWLMFAVCMFEVVLWAAPPVSAIASSGHSLVTGDLYRNHMLKDKDHYTHANGLNQQTEVDQPQVDTVKRLLDEEARVRILELNRNRDLADSILNASTQALEMHFHSPAVILTTALSLLSLLEWKHCNLIRSGTSSLGHS